MSWEYVRWKPFNFVVGVGPAHEKVLISISDKSNSTKPYEIIEEDPGGPPGRRKQNKARSEQGKEYI